MRVARAAAMFSVVALAGLCVGSPPTWGFTAVGPVGAPAPLTQSLGGAVGGAVPAGVQVALPPIGRAVPPAAPTPAAPAASLATVGRSVVSPAARPGAAGTGVRGTSVRAASDYSPSSGVYTPPVHGSSPHGEATAVGVTTEPRSTPDAADCNAVAPDELLVLGRSCGEQQADGSYHGHITVLALAGQELLGVDSTPSGSRPTGPLAPLATAVSQGNGTLAQLCSGSGGQLCLSVLDTSSSTTATGSSNSFEGAGADVGGSGGVSASLVQSSGDVAQQGGCQTAAGRSSVGTVDARGTELVSAGNTSESSTACRDGSRSQTSSASVAGGAVAPLGAAALPAGCAAGAPNTPVTPAPLAPVAVIECNATDDSGNQVGAPSGANEGLTAIAAGTVGIHTPGAEAVARPPAGGSGTGAVGAPTGGSSVSGLAGAGGGGGSALAGAPIGAAGPSGAMAPAGHSPGSGDLPFTGANLLLELLAALCLTGVGGGTLALLRRPS